MPHCLVLVCHHLPPPQTTSHSPTKPPWLHHANTHTMLSKVLDGGVCGVSGLHACASTHLVPWSITTTVCGCHSLSPCHATPSMSSTPNHVNRCAMCGCGASCPHTSQTCLLHALHGGCCVVVCSFTLVLMPHHQLCTPWAAMPWCVATSVFVLCVSCLPLCPQPPCCTIGVCVVGQHQVSVVVGLFVD